MSISIYEILQIDKLHDPTLDYIFSELYTNAHLTFLFMKFSNKRLLLIAVHYFVRHKKNNRFKLINQFGVNSIVIAFSFNVLRKSIYNIFFPSQSSTLIIHISINIVRVKI